MLPFPHALPRRGRDHRSRFAHHRSLVPHVRDRQTGRRKNGRVAITTDISELSSLSQLLPRAVAGSPSVELPPSANAKRYLLPTGAQDPLGRDFLAADTLVVIACYWL